MKLSSRQTAPYQLTEPEKLNMSQQNQVAGNQSREIKYDVLKALGILLIILAHSKPPAAVEFLRSFDVPMMVIVSGSLFYYSSHNRSFSFLQYLRKRIPRLITPVWLFLAFFFSSAWAISWAIGDSNPYIFNFSPQQIFLSFAIFHGMNYVWIIRVFVLVAIASPLLLKLYYLCKKEQYFLIVLALIYLFYEFILRPLKDTQDFGFAGYLLFELIVLYLIPYSCLFGLGLCLPRLTQTKILFIALGASAVFTTLCLSLHLEEIGAEAHKYPPDLLYISYGIAISLLLYLLIEYISLKLNIEKHTSFVKLIVFMSSSTLWIYLWHIFMLQYWVLISHRSPLTNHFFTTFLVVALFSGGMTYIQKYLMSWFVQNTQFGNQHSQTLATLFLK